MKKEIIKEMKEKKKRKFRDEEFFKILLNQQEKNLLDIPLFRTLFESLTNKELNHQEVKKLLKKIDEVIENHKEMIELYQNEIKKLDLIKSKFKNRKS